MANPDFVKYIKTIPNPYPKKKVAKIEFSVVVENAEGTVWVTDTKFQDGAFATGWDPNTKEVMENWEDTEVKHYNAIVRGQKGLYIPNSGDTMGYANWTVIADTDIPKPKTPDDGTWKGWYSIEFGTLHRTRNLRMNGPVAKGDKFEFWNNPRRIAKNDVYFGQYMGFFLGAPAGDMYMLVSLPGEQRPADAYDKTSRYVAEPQTDKRVRVLLGVTPRWLAEGGKRV